MDNEALGYVYNRIEKYHTNRGKTNIVEGRETYDYIVIGSGSSGSVVASRLSEDKDATVLLLEAGGPDNDFRLSAPMFFTKLYKSRFDWSYDSTPQSRMNDNIINSPRGKVLGGSSSINAMIYMRGSKYDYDEWEKLGAKGWGWDDVLPYFKKSERNLNKKESRFHGTEGEWIISDVEHTEMQKDLREAISDSLNIPLKDDVNGEDYATEGVALSQFNIVDGARFSVSDAFLSNKVLARENLFVKVWAQVTRILFDEADKTKAVGVEVDFVRGHETRKIYANKEIILSAGAFNSPQIMMLSGIGDSKDLKKHNIEVIHDIPEVGKNLHDHLITFVTWVPTNWYDSLHSVELDPRLLVKAIYDYFFNNKNGPLKHHSVSINAVLKSENAKKNNEPAPDLQFLAFDAVPPYSPREKMTSLYQTQGGISLIPCILQPKSRGTVTLKSSNYLDDPLIDYNFFADRDDEERIVDAWKKAESVAKSKKVSDKLGKRIYVEKDYANDEELKEQLYKRYFTMYHPTSTLAIGKVVDERLRVKGLKGLRVADASIMPQVTRGNTNAPCVMIGEKAADMIREDNK